MVVALMCGSYATAQVAVSADRATQIEWSRQYAQVGDLSNAFFASQTLWTDGFYVYKLFAAEGKVFLEPISMRLLPEKSPRSIEMVMKNGKLTVKNTKEVVAHEIIGGWDLLVFRDKKQKTKNTFVRVKEQTDKFDDMMERDLHLIYDGLYELFSVDEGEAFYPNTLAPIGAKVLFGFKLRACFFDELFWRLFDVARIIEAIIECVDLLAELKDAIFEVGEKIRASGVELIVVSPALSVDTRMKEGSKEYTPLAPREYDAAAEAEALALTIDKYANKPSGLSREGFAELKEGCAKRGWGYIDAFTPSYRWLYESGLPWSWYSRDYVHSGELGKQVLARIMLEYFTATPLAK